MKKSISKQKCMPVFSRSDVSTVHQSRCSVYQATRRPLWAAERKIETPWGTATVKGRLGQNHQDVLDACFSVAEKRVTADDGRIFLQIDPYLLRKKLGGLPHAKIEEWLQELRSATVEIRAQARGIWAMGGIIDEAVASHKPIPDSGKGGVIRTGERHYLRVVVSRIWAGMMKQDLPTGYRGHLDDILALKSGISQAVARMMLTHAGAAKMTVIDALAATGAEVSHDHRSRVVESLMRDSAAMAQMGITVTPVMISITPPVPGELVSSRRPFPDTPPPVAGTTPPVPGLFGSSIGI